MKRLAMTLGTVLASLTLAVTPTMPANAATQAVGTFGPAGDQDKGPSWSVSSQNAQKASDLRSAVVENDGTTIAVTWTLESVLPSTNTSYDQQTRLVGYLSAKPLQFVVSGNGASASITYDNVHPQCSGLVTTSRNTTAKTITLKTPLWCLPGGYNLSIMGADVVVWRNGASWVGSNGYNFPESLPWK